MGRIGRLRLAGLLLSVTLLAAMRRFITDQAGR